MKRVLFAAGVVVALLVAAPAPAKTVTVDISRLGFVPAAVTVQTGDSITWTNKDTANHQVVCATCPFTSNVLAPGQTTTFTFTKVGKFTTVDPLNKNKKGTVTVTAPGPTVSIAATPSRLTYGNAASITGTLSTAQANQKVDILAKPCGETNAKVVATVTTGAAGGFSYQPQTPLSTSYQAQTKPASGTVTSTAVNVSVRPIMTLSRVGLHRFNVKVAAAQSFVGKAVVLYRYVAARHKWTRVTTAFLGTKTAAPTPIAGTTVSGVTFKVKLKHRLKVRANLPALQAAPCYLAQKSPTILS